MNTDIKKQMAEWGRMGGKKTQELYGQKHFKNISKKGVKARKQAASGVIPSDTLDQAG